METTFYFRNEVMVKRPYLTAALCEAVVRSPYRTEVQSDNRIRHWAFSTELGKWLRVVTLADGNTLHNAFPDRRFIP